MRQVFFDYLGNKNLISYKRKRAAQTVEEKKKERAIFELLPTSYFPGLAHALIHWAIDNKLHKLAYSVTCLIKSETNPRGIKHNYILA